jgi:F-type H+-transporting ATPase subunit gamma
MAVGKEIRAKIKSFENTKKITKAMEMVSVSKMRKAQERMRSARPYSDKVRNIAANLSQANPEYRSPYMRPGGNAKAVGMVIVTSDKGLCGGLNTNVLRIVTNKMRELQAAGSSVQAVAIGNKGLGFCNRIGVKVVSQATQFINTMKQEPVIEQLLPLSAERLAQSEAEKSQYGWDYLYEPDAPTVIDNLLTRYIEALVYQAVAENMASEQSARMVAMKAATENAGNMIAELKLVYNKTRQAAITKELSEIVGGAAALA